MRHRKKKTNYLLTKYQELKTEKKIILFHIQRNNHPITNMTGMCRLCASLKRVLITVTDQSGDIAQKLLVCCRLQLEKEGPLPKSVCSECMEHLDTSYKFLTQVQEAQEKLHAFFGTQFEKVATAVSDDNTQSFTISSVSTLTPHTTNQVREYILPEATVTNVKQELPYDEQLADAQMDAMALHTSADNWTSAVDQNIMSTDEVSWNYL